MEYFSPERTRFTKAQKIALIKETIEQLKEHIFMCIAIRHAAVKLGWYQNWGYAPSDLLYRIKQVADLMPKTTAGIGSHRVWFDTCDPKPRIKLLKQVLKNLNA